jgi:two-component system nitrate/nitrite response regulator NarL
MTRGLALIADPSPLFCEGLRRLLRQGHFQVCAEGSDIAEATTRLDDAADLALVICTLSRESIQDTIPALVNLRTRFPLAKIVVIADRKLHPSMWRETVDVVDAVLAREISGKILQISIDLVLLGQRFFSVPLFEAASAAETPGARAPSETAHPVLADTWHVSGSIIGSVNQTPVIGASPLAEVALTLSERERQILRCLVCGHSNKVIARELNIAEATVKVHVKGLLRKLRAANRTQAAVWASNNGTTLNGVDVLAAE